MTAVLCLLIALCVPGDAAADAKWEVDQWIRGGTDWRGHAVGTSVHTRTTSTWKIPGVAKPRTLVLEERRTLQELDVAQVVYTVARKLGATWQTPERLTEALTTVESVTLPKPARTEKIRIGTTEYTCQVHEGVKRTRGERVERATLWVHPTAGVLKFKGVVSTVSGRAMSWVVKKLGASRVVGGVTYAAREIAIEGRHLSGTAVVCTDVPGGLLELTIEVVQGAARSTVRQELVSFKKP